MGYTTPMDLRPRSSRIALAILRPLSIALAVVGLIAFVIAAVRLQGCYLRWLIE